MRKRNIGRAAIVALAVTSFAACGDDDDDDDEPVEDIGDTVESVVDDLTDDSEVPTS
jgi:hypothetical protein